MRKFLHNHDELKIHSEQQCVSDSPILHQIPDIFVIMSKRRLGYMDKKKEEVYQHLIRHTAAAARKSGKGCFEYQS